MKATWLLRECEARTSGCTARAAHVLSVCLHRGRMAFSYRVPHRWMGIRGITHETKMDSTGDMWEGSVGTSRSKSTPLDGHQGWFELKDGVVCQAAAQHLVVHDVACLRMCKSQRRYHVVKTKRGARTDPQAREKRERSYARKTRCIVRKGDRKRIKKEKERRAPQTTSVLTGTLYHLGVPLGPELVCLNISRQSLSD